MWTWGTLSDQVLGGLLNGPMKALENELALRERVMPTQAKAQTTNATVTTLVAIPLPANQSVVVSGFVVARRTGGSSGSTNDGAGYRVEAVATNTGGTAALITAATVTTLGESQAAWAVTVDVSGGDLRIRVAGAANNDVSWRYTCRTLSVKE